MSVKTYDVRGKSKSEWTNEELQAYDYVRKNANSGHAHVTTEGVSGILEFGKGAKVVFLTMGPRVIRYPKGHESPRGRFFKVLSQLERKRFTVLSVSLSYKRQFSNPNYPEITFTY